MRSAVVISGLVGVIAGIAGDQLWQPHDGEPALAREIAARDAGTGRFEQCIARLDAIDARLERIAATPAAPVRAVEAAPTSTRLEERLAAIEAAIDRLAASSGAPATSRDDPLRRAKDSAAISRLFEAEYRKPPQRSDDHQGHSPDWLYARYGAPDVIERAANDSTIQRWVYFESGDERGVYFELQNGVVLRSWAYAR